MTRRERLGIWLLGLGALGWLTYVLGSVLPPFALGAALAYLLDPTCTRLVRLGLPRGAAAALLIAAGIAVTAAVLLVLVPLLIEQGARAAIGLPDAIERLRLVLNDRLGKVGGDEMMTRLVEAVRDRASSLSGEALAQAWAGGKALLGFVGILVVTPVVTFYLLFDWERLLASLDDLVPPRNRGAVHAIAGDIDRVLSAMLRGQFTVCLTLGVFYAAALSLIGLNFGLLIGLFSGAISFIPYVGAAIGGVLSVGMAIAQFWEAPEMIVAVGGVYAVGQAFEGNVLTPYLVGSAVRLHPVWLLFALAVCGALFGFVGLLIAVPLAAVIGVLVRRAVTRYKRSGLYVEAASQEE